MSKITPFRIQLHAPTQFADREEASTLRMALAQERQYGMSEATFLLTRHMNALWNEAAEVTIQRLVAEAKEESCIVMPDAHRLIELP